MEEQESHVAAVPQVDGDGAYPVSLLKEKMKALDSAVASSSTPLIHVATSSVEFLPSYSPPPHPDDVLEDEDEQCHSEPMMQNKNDSSTGKVQKTNNFWFLPLLQMRSSTEYQSY